MEPHLHSWTPNVSTEAIWKSLSRESFCAIFDVDEWRIGALSSSSEWWYQGPEWTDLSPFTAPLVQLPNNHIAPPPFLEGLLAIISFDGLLHGWIADHSVAYHKPSNQWYFWGTSEQFQTILSMISETQSHSSQIAQQDLVGHSMTQAQYENTVTTVQEAIKNGNVYQINLAHRIGPYTIANPITTWLDLTDDNPAQHACFWKTPTEILLGNSPELFLKFGANGAVSSVPIKGTHADIGNPQAHFELWDSPKEHAELTMIVDMMRNDISSISEYGSVFTEHRQIRRCGDLLHAEQKVMGQRKSGMSILKAVHACFPPASVTGAPKEAALSYIRNLEPVNREWYTGSFGFVDKRGHSEWNVIIRTLQGKQNNDGSMSAYLNIGAGIVYDSIAAAEWFETMNKGRAIERTLTEETKETKETKET